MTTLQVRDVPEELSRKLKERAAAEGRSLSDYLLRELQALAERPTRAELYWRLDMDVRVDLPAAADVLAAERASR